MTNEQKSDLGKRIARTAIKVVLGVVLTFVVITVVCVLIFNDKDKPATQTSAPPTPLPTRSYTPQEQKNIAEYDAHEKKYGKAPEMSGWNSSYPVVRDFLVASAKDPDSIKFEGCGKVLRDSKSGWVVGCSYYGKNSFGAQVKSFNWFIVRQGRVVSMQNEDAYQR